MDLSRDLISHTLYLLILMNPVSKVFILSTFIGNSKDDTPSADLRSIPVRSTIIALALLLLTAVAGRFILQSVFQVDLFSLRVAGGIILLLVGLKALTRGVFFELETGQRLSDLSIVPLASPMIAGPATITAVINLAAEFGLSMTIVATVLAGIVNLLIMELAGPITYVCKRWNIMGAIIRITGLVVASIAVQMILAGLREWYRTLGQ